MSVGTKFGKQKGHETKSGFYNSFQSTFNWFSSISKSRGGVRTLIHLSLRSGHFPLKNNPNLRKGIQSCKATFNSRSFVGLRGDEREDLLLGSLRSRLCSYWMILFIPSFVLPLFPFFFVAFFLFILFFFLSFILPSACSSCSFLIVLCSISSISSFLSSCRLFFLSACLSLNLKGVLRIQHGPKMLL